MLLRRPSEGLSLPNLNRAALLLEGDPSDYSRRLLLKRSGAVALGLWLANSVEQQVTQWDQETYHSRGTSLQIIGNGDRMSPLFGVSFGGEGNFNDYWSARSMYSAGRKKIPWANMVYDNERGLNFVDMARVLQAAQKQRQFQYLIVDGDSLGGMFGMYAALLANIPVAGFMADSSPMRLSDAVRSAVITADFVTRAPKSEFVETLELGAKDLYCDVRDQGVEDFVANLANNISSLPSQMAQGASPQLQRDQLGWAGIIDMSNLAHLYRERGIIQAGITQPIFLRAAHDGVIRPETAYADWKGWFASEFDIRMPLLQMRPGSGHADVFAAATCVQAEGYLDYLIHQFRSPTMVIE